jgi:peptidoglycan/LPS O-acetylase OafA/YrhL
MRHIVKWIVTKASRETTSGQFIAVIDGLRFIAIFSVILFHVYTFISRKAGTKAITDPLELLLSHGNIGVQLFFIISGFIIALPFAKGHFGYEKHPQLRQYFYRRLTRLEPPYILNLLICCPIALYVTHIKIGDLIPHLIASIAYLHTIIYGEMSAVNFVTWSLEVELQFYVLAPVISLLFLLNTYVRRGLLVLLITFFSVMSYMIDTPRYNLSILAMAQYFLTGFLLVDIYLCEWKQAPTTSYRWDVISVLAWTTICVLLFKGKLGELFVIIPMFLAYYSAFKGVWSNYFFSKPIIYVIGGMCYTLYLYHFLVTFAIGRLIEKAGILNQAPPWLSIITISLIAIPIILLFCTILFVFIEKPCMRKDWHLTLFERLRLGVKGVTES